MTKGPSPASSSDIGDASGSGSTGQPPKPEDQCRHTVTRTERGLDGNFITLRRVCAACGRVVEVENVLFGLDLLRCPVDPVEERCFTSCPVEEGSSLVFERPCLPVRKVMEAAGIKLPWEPPALQ